MFPILDARWLAPEVKWFRIHAPLVASHRHPGQFVIVRVEETGERIPLTIANADAGAGTIELVVKSIGKTTRVLCAKNAGDFIADVAGPLGRPTEIVHGTHAVIIGGGVGTAVVYPLALPLISANNYVTAIIGAKTRELLIFEHELVGIAQDVWPCTDDGTYGYHGTVTEKLEELLDTTLSAVGAVYAAGPVPMMRAVAELTRLREIHTIVSLNPIMVDGTGMCGGCRVSVGGKRRFACIDGPDFDAHQVDFDDLSDRLVTYRQQEQQALDLCFRPSQLDAKCPEVIAKEPSP